MLSQVVSGIRMASDYVPEAKLVIGAVLAVESGCLVYKNELVTEAFNALKDLFRETPKPVPLLPSRKIIVEGCVGYGLVFLSLYTLVS